MSKFKGIRPYQDEFVRLYEEGQSIRSIALQYGLNKGTVARLIKEKVEIRSTKTSMELINQMGVLYEQGYSKREISRQLGCSLSTVLKWLDVHYGIEIESTQPWLLEDQVEEVKAQYEAGESLVQLAKVYQVSVTHLHRLLKRYDTEFRSYHEAGRKYPLNETYFETLNPFKSYLLGQLYAIGNGYHHQHAIFIDLKVKKERIDDIESLVRPFTQFDPSRLAFNEKGGVVTFRMMSVAFYHSLTRLGFPNHLPRTKEGFDEEFFWKGFFKFRYYERPSKPAIYLGFRKECLCRAFLSYWERCYGSTVGFNPNASHGLLVTRKAVINQYRAWLMDDEINNEKEVLTHEG